MKLRTALLTGPAENCSISSPVRLLIQKMVWASDEGFKIASCVAPVAPQARRLYSIQIWRVIRWLFQAFADSSHGGIVERHVQCAQSPMHESATQSGSSRLHSSMNFGIRN